MRPHNLTLVMLGAGLLWFGWFGFNAGSALGANQTAAVVFTTTLLAGAAGSLGWLHPRAGALRTRHLARRGLRAWWPGWSRSRRRAARCRRSARS